MTTPEQLLEDLAAGGQDIAQLYADAMDSSLRIAEAVKEGQWGDQSAASEWTNRDVANHITYENLWAAELIGGKTMAEVGDALEGDLVGDDPLGAYRDSVTAAKAVILAPGAMDVICDLSSGPTVAGIYALQLFQDLLIHGWDIAVGSGQDTTLDETLLAAELPMAKLTREIYSDSGAFGNNIELPPDADLQARVLALLGRRDRRQ